VSFVVFVVQKEDLESFAVFFINHEEHEEHEENPTSFFPAPVWRNARRSDHKSFQHLWGNNSPAVGGFPNGNEGNRNRLPCWSTDRMCSCISSDSVLSYIPFGCSLVVGCASAFAAPGDHQTHGKQQNQLPNNYRRPFVKNGPHKTAPYYCRNSRQNKHARSPSPIHSYPP
jgi:hypothetical protein